MTLEDYLPTHILELTVHTCDLAAALGVSADVAPWAVADAFAVIGALGAVQGTASAALLALTGRRPLPAGSSARSFDPPPNSLLTRVDRGSVMYRCPVTDQSAVGVAASAVGVEPVWSPWLTTGIGVGGDWGT